METLLLVDGNSLINRAYYATSLINGATYGFFTMLFKEILDIKATHVIVTFDARAKTFRHEMYDQYKAGRKPMPDDLAEQLFDTKELLSIMGVKMFEKPGFEADDLMGTISRLSKTKTVILTADRDMLQLVNDNVHVYLTKTGVTHIEEYDSARIEKEFGVTPRQLIEVKALMGDTSDNIPGARGVGEKTALKYIAQYKTAEAASQDPKLIDQIDSIMMSRKLTEIKCDVDMEFDITKCVFSLPMSREVLDEFKKRRFNTLCAKRELWNEADLPKMVIQQSFFNT
ncbi:MAG: hypothetical protein FWC00_03485 [Firmicutes bacterium]|nr:hypothetical protein [Bacillota bacterium]